MKVLLIALALIGVGYAAPQPRKLFHEHVEDFLDVIFQEAGDELATLSEQYMESEEFRAVIDYMITNSFRELVAEMESLPEFNAVVQFLENDNIDIMYFIDLVHEMLDQTRVTWGRSRQQASGTTFVAFINDVIALFPKEKLAALFDEKMATDEEFRVAMENLFSQEWDNVFGALWNNEVFQAEVQTLAANGIDISVLLLEVVAVFGQN